MPSRRSAVCSRRSSSESTGRCRSTRSERSRPPSSAADANVRVSEWDMEKWRQQMRMDVRRAYYGLQLARDAKDVAARRARPARQGARRGSKTSSRRAIASVTEIDRLRLEAYRAGAHRPVAAGPEGRRLRRGGAALPDGRRDELRRPRRAAQAARRGTSRRSRSTSKPPVFSGPTSTWRAPGSRRERRSSRTTGRGSSPTSASPSAPTSARPRARPRRTTSGRRTPSTTSTTTSASGCAGRSTSCRRRRASSRPSRSSKRRARSSDWRSERDVRGREGLRRYARGQGARGGVGPRRAHRQAVDLDRPGQHRSRDERRARAARAAARLRQRADPAPLRAHGLQRLDEQPRARERLGQRAPRSDSPRLTRGRSRARGAPGCAP